jgi:hypothetical protein
MRWIEAVLVPSLAPIVLLALPACGGAPPPPPTLANTEASIRAAIEVGAQSDPQGALHLSLAQEEVNTAKKLLADKDVPSADLTLSKAAVDAELALAEARAAQSRAQTQQAQDQAKMIKAQH